MDNFHLRSPASKRRASHPEARHPFLGAYVDAFAPGHDSGQSVAIGRHDLGIYRLNFVCRAHCKNLAAHREVIEPAETTPSEYRTKPIASYFRSGDLKDLSNPVAGVLSATTTEDATSLITAKVSGFFVQYGEESHYIRAWGGHCDTSSLSMHVGLVEGIERICCADPDPDEVLKMVPEGVRTVTPSDFGLDPDHWPLPNPVIGAWTLGVDLSNNNQVALPTRTVYFEARIDEPVYVQDSSNGCAVGGTDAEAQLYGLLEVIERDAFLLAWYGNLPLPVIDQTTICDAESLDYLRRLRLVGRNIRFLDATVGISVPTVIVVCDTPSGGVCLGAGSHPSPERALRSALVEAASDFQVVEEHADQRRTELQAMLADPFLVRTVEDHADLFGLPEARAWLTGWAAAESPAPTPVGDIGQPPVSLASLARRDDAGDSVESDLEDTVRRIEEAGFSPIAVNVASTLSRRHGFSCFKAVVPGLLPLDFGWGRQRALKMERLAKRSREYLEEHGYDSGSYFPHVFPHPFP
ncbi:YcaO-like family protein [Arthrobacter sp. G119Y2]|uniref:YcaO-like family protein n=1 Tax=Arthrobacter sp. G119Y2 TaxID=3134965 RepID=UPI00311A916B